MKLHLVLAVMQVTGCHGQQFRKPWANFSLEVKFLAVVLEVTPDSCFEHYLLVFSLCSLQKPHDKGRSVLISVRPRIFTEHSRSISVPQGLWACVMCSE